MYFDWAFLITDLNKFFRYDPHTAYRSQAVGGGAHEQNPGHDHEDNGHDSHSHDGHGHAMDQSDEKWEEDGGGGGSKEHAHRMIANIYPSECSSSFTSECCLSFPL